MNTDHELDDLRSRWSVLYSKTLPSLARQRDPAQPKWPVTLDHCFARIILDNTIGAGKSQWDQVVKKPAVKNMTLSQFKDAIELGEKIQSGTADLVQLDQQSLRARGKGQQKYKDLKGTTSTKKRGHSDVSPSKHTEENSPKKHRQSHLSFSKQSQPAGAEEKPDSRKTPRAVHAESFPKPCNASNPVISNLLHKIARNSSLTDFRKRLYSMLLSVPTGSYTTYAAMATSLKSSARAVGNGMRNNPYAPEVPCHRVLAADGSIGGFHGDWGKNGKHANKKIELLKSEGVTFDSRSRVKGPVFTDLQDLSKAGKIIG